MRRRDHLQLVSAMGVVTLLAAVIAASMSDRVPSLARQYRHDIPLPDWMLSFEGVFGLHFFLWATLAFGTAMLAVQWRTRLLFSAALFADSLVLELLQDRYTTLRHYQHIDIAANAVGIGLGVIGGAFVLGVADQVRRNPSMRRTGRSR